jgi:ABC-2 type transport system ATP-binding protein
MKAIETRELSKSYGSVVALRGVSFSVDRGEVIGLLGPNGAGKTTLMKILTGYMQPDAGEARIVGADVVERPLEVQSRIGYLPESAPLYAEMAVQEYLEMMAELRGVLRDAQRARISEAVYATALEEYLTWPIGKLSKGYRQRVGIAQAILHKPELLILDEPTSGLDPTQIIEIRALIRRLSEHATVMLSTHILSEVEMTCERAIIIIKGELRADAPLAELRSAHTRAAVVAIEAGASGVRETLEKVEGVTAVQEQAGEGDGPYRRWRVTSESGSDLCPALFEVLRHKSWKVAELRSDTKNLEAVFRELAEQSDGAPTKEEVVQ